MPHIQKSLGLVKVSTHEFSEDINIQYIAGTYTVKYEKTWTQASDYLAYSNLLHLNSDPIELCLHLFDV